LFGNTSGKLKWNFENKDKVRSVKINESKLFGNCIALDLTLAVEGEKFGLKTLNFKVGYLVLPNDDFILIGLN
jgi:hypothetical protein